MTDRAAILLSVKPRWWDLIRTGRKTRELRRVTPRDLVPGMPIVWYVSAPVSAIAGEAVCGAIRAKWDALRYYWDVNLNDDDKACAQWRREVGMAHGKALKYWRGASSPCAIWLREVREYAEPIGLPGRVDDPRDPLGCYVLTAPQSYRYLSADQLAAIRAAGGV